MPKAESGRDPQGKPTGGVVSTRAQKIGAYNTGVDWVAEEAPLELRIAGESTAVLMRTPGHDEELVRGFLFNEGAIKSAGEIVSVTIAPQTTGPEHGSVIDVVLRPSPAAVPIDRTGLSNASCGVCGKRTLESLALSAPAASSTLAVAARVLYELPDRLRSQQPAFQKTGGLHAAALFTAGGELVAVREDVGRHNAADKLIGWALAAGMVPLVDYGLIVSGRVSYEIVQKALAAAIPLIAAVGAPTSLAVSLAERFHMTIAGFLRGGSMTVYGNRARVVE